MKNQTPLRIAALPIFSPGGYLAQTIQLSCPIGGIPMLLYFLLYLAAAICFGLAAFSVAVRRVNLVALGLLFWVLVFVIQALQKL